MDTTKTITHLGLCAGYGGIELGLKRAIPNLRSVALCEIEAFACANLVAKMEEGLMDAAPIWTDLKSFPWSEFRGRVDILTGGYPCQPFSAAGKRLGTDDPRHLWPFIADGIRILRPKLCFFENVEGHISLGLREVIGELESIGYQTAWGIFSAAEVGAPHQRKRVFILAYDSSSGLQGREWIRQAGTQGASSGYIAERSGSVAVSNSLGGASGLSRSLAGHEGFAGIADDCGSEGCGELADPAIGRRDRQHARSRSDVGQWATPQDIGPEVAHAGSCGTAQVWPSRPGEPQHAWEPPRVVKPPLGRDADGPTSGMDYAELQVTCDNRTDELRLLGNGVVPATAERAFRFLWHEIIQSVP